MVNVQQWLDNNYPLENRNEAIKISLRREKLIGALIIDNWPNLEEIDCANNYLDQLVINECSKIKKINIFCSGLTSLKFLVNLNSKELIHLDVSHNNISLHNLSIFGRFDNLEELDISNNDFEGNLAYLLNCKKLRSLKILNNYKVNGNLENLPESLETIYCNGEWVKQLQNYKIGQYWNRGIYFDYYNYQNWKKDNQELFVNSNYNLQKEELNTFQQLKNELEQERAKNNSLQKEHTFYKDFFDNYLNTRKQELEILKSKLNEEEQERLETYLKAQQEYNQTPFVKKQLKKVQEKLSEKLTEEELASIVNKQKEIVELEQQLKNLQIEEQLAQIQISPK